MSLHYFTSMLLETMFPTTRKVRNRDEIFIEVGPQEEHSRTFVCLSKRAGDTTKVCRILVVSVIMGNDGLVDG